MGGVLTTKVKLHPSNLEVLQPALPGCLVMPPQWALSLQTVLLQAQGSIGGLSVQR